MNLKIEFTTHIQTEVFFKEQTEADFLLLISNTSKNLSTIRKPVNFPCWVFLNALLYLDYTVEGTEGKGIPLPQLRVPL